jgi:hypothetical protein
MFHRTRLALLALVASLFVASAGCESDSPPDHHRRTDRTRISDRSIDRDDDAYDREHRLDDRDAVLSSDRVLSGVPRNARRIDSAQGSSEMMYTARRDATIYVYDADADKVVYTGSLQDGDRFVLDPNDNLALINGKKVLDRDLKSRHVFRLYVLEDRDRARY